MEQRIIIKFLVNESFSADQVLAKLQPDFEKRAYALRTVGVWIREI
jgi:hypothetical protein